MIVEFHDSGPGLTPAQKKGLFGSLLRSTKPRGVGLGLAVVARVVEAHQGQIQVISRPGQGACFRLYLPVAPD